MNVLYRKRLDELENRLETIKKEDESLTYLFNDAVKKVSYEKELTEKMQENFPEIQWVESIGPIGGGDACTYGMKVEGMLYLGVKVITTPNLKFDFYQRTKEETSDLAGVFIEELKKLPKYRLLSLYE